MRLEASGLRRTVEGRVLFEDLGFAVEPGDTLVVAGPSGSGKTQLLRLLAALDPLEAGRVALDGRTPEQWGIPSWRVRVCYVAQQAPEYPGTPRNLLERIGRFAAQAERVVEDPVAIARGWDLPEETWDKRWVKLSGGERQRAALAIALSRGPDVLLLDEPTSAVDPAATRAVERDLAAVTSVWVTHDEEQAERVADRVHRLAS